MSTDLFELKRKMTEQELALLNSEMNRLRKSTGLAYFLLLLLGCVGVHRFYLGKPFIPSLMIAFLCITLFAYWKSEVARSSAVYHLQEALSIGYAFSNPTEAEKLVRDEHRLQGEHASEIRETWTGRLFAAVLMSAAFIGLVLLVDMLTMPRQIRRKNDWIEDALIRRIFKSKS